MWYLCMLFHRLLDYRKAKVHHPLWWRLPPHDRPDSPFHFVRPPFRTCRQNIANRSVVVKGMYEVWGEGGSYEELEESIRSYPDELKLPYLDSDSTFKINVDTFGKVISLEEQTQHIRQLTYIHFKMVEIAEKFSASVDKEELTVDISGFEPRKKLTSPTTSMAASYDGDSYKTVAPLFHQITHPLPNAKIIDFMKSKSLASGPHTMVQKQFVVPAPLQ